MKKIKKSISVLLMMALLGTAFAGCGKAVEEKENEAAKGDNVIITETGEVVEKYPQPTEESEPEKTEEPEQEKQAEETASPEIQEPLVDLTEPEQEQVITEEDQIEPTGSELQIVFLGDSIFDNSRDGTGIPYLTSVQCEADVSNLAIAGTSATPEYGESMENAEWTSRSLVGVVKALKGEISTDVFAGTRTKDILDNKDIDWANTDYFVVEYGINDFFRAMPLDNTDQRFDLYTYAGALRYAVSNLKELGTDATIILCGPNYARFFNDEGWMIGDGNSLNTGHGTLFDYKGICEYVAKEYDVEFFDAYMDLGIDGYTAEEYLEDGVHMTAAGRQLYADALAQMILKIEENKNN